MSPRTRVIFRWLPHNRYTVAALVGLLDGRLDPDRFEIKRASSQRDVEKLSRGADASVIAYSFTTNEAPCIADEIRSVSDAAGPGVAVICGGPHATARPREVLSWGADAAFVGEAEESLSAFIEQYDDDGIVPARIVEALPLGDFDEYPPFAASRGLFAPIELRRGCVNRCTFCQTPRLHPHIRERSIAAVVHHAEALRAAGKRRVSFIASDALLYGSRDGHVDLAAIEALLAPLKRMGMDVAFGFFPSEIGPATLARCPEAAMLLKRYVSNREIVIGAQSASERMLGRLSRPHTLQDVEDAVAAVVAAGLAPVVDILVCAPGESSDERRETLAWMKQLHARTRARFNLHHFMPLPGTPLEHERPQSIEADAVEELRQLVASGVALGHFTPAWFDTARVEIAASS